MGYRYDEFWLNEREEIISVLLDTIEKGDVLMISRQNHAEISRIQLEYNNILASCAINRPQLRLRERCRTWMRHDEDGWKLFIGTPTHRIRGKPVATVIRPDALVPRAVPVAPRQSEEGVLVLDKGYSDDNVPALILDLIRASDMKPNSILVSKLTIKKPETILRVAFEKLQTEYGWQAVDLQEEDGMLKGFALVRS